MQVYRFSVVYLLILVTISWIQTGQADRETRTSVKISKILESHFKGKSDSYINDELPKRRRRFGDGLMQHDPRRNHSNMQTNSSSTSSSSSSSSLPDLFIQATAIHVDQAEFPLSKLLFKLTLKLALDTLEKNLVSRKVRISLNMRSAASCTNQYAAALAAEEYYTRRSRLFIISGCDDAIKGVSRLASSWQVPLMTAAGFRAEFNDKKTHKTLTRVAFSLRAAVEFLVKIMKSFSWQRVNLIVDESDPGSLALQEGIDSNIVKYKSDDFKVVLNTLPLDLASLIGTNESKKLTTAADNPDSWPNEATKGAIRLILKQSALFSKVTILLIPQLYLRRFMLSVYDQNMANGRYSFINIPLLLQNNNDDINGEYSMGSQDQSRQGFTASTGEEVLVWRHPLSTRNLQARRAFESLMSIYVKTPTGKQYAYFAKNISEMANSNFTKSTLHLDKSSMVKAKPKEFKRIQINVNPYSASFYDCIQIYGRILNQSLAEIENQKDPTIRRLMSKSLHANLSNHMRNRRYENMLTGTVYINENGDRETDYTLDDMNQMTGKYWPVIAFSGETKKMERKAEISWSSDSSISVTEDNVECELTNTCPKQGLSKLMVTLLFTSAPFITIIVVVVYFVYKHISLESQLVDYWWKVKLSDIEILVSRRKIAADGAGSSDDKTSVISSLNLSANTHSEHGGKTTITNVSTTICTTYGNILLGNYKLGRVALKPISRFRQSRKMMLELRTIKTLNHNNLSRFVGIITDESNLALVTEFCPKGSLREFFQNESMVIDWTFKCSIINDIIAGLVYLHSSQIGLHGRLKSANCLVNSRFQIKLSDYGLQSLFDQIDSHSDEEILMRKLVWRAPEHLRSSIRKYSKRGDVYSLGLLLYEVLTGKLPFYDHDKDDYVIPLKDLVDELKAHGPSELTGPQFETIDYTENESVTMLVDLIRKCIAYDPNIRPTLLVINTALKKITHGVTSKKLLQNLSERMEQYTSNLESLVDSKLSALVDEKLRTEELLYQFVPKSIASLLKEGQNIEPEAFECVTVFFSDIVGFTSLSSESTPMQVIDFLSELYLCFDETLDNYDIFKIDIVGDAYIVASGLPDRNEGRHVIEIARAALHLRQRLRTFQIAHKPGRSLEMRVGIHSGPCVGGIVGGIDMPKYCVFGETLSTGKYMESSGMPMKIHVTEESKKLLDGFSEFKIEPRLPKITKDGLQIQTYWLEGDVDVNQMESV